jgi:chitinase
MQHTAPRTDGAPRRRGSWRLWPWLGLLLATAAQADVRIVGYVAGWQPDWKAADLAGGRLTHIHYAFADIRHGRVATLHEWDGTNLAALRGLRPEHPELRLLISVGGWHHSRHFSEVARTARARRRFAASAVAFVTEHGLDGVDIDWEYPGQRGAGNVHRPEDKRHFTLLLAELREQLDERSRTDGRADRPYLLTIAAGADQTYLDHTEMGPAAQYLDYICLMTYDFRTGADHVTGHHANLYPSDQTPGVSADDAVQRFVQAGVPAAKLVLGVPFYGRYWTGVDDAGHGLHQPAPRRGERGTIAFDRIRDELLGREGVTRHWDERARAAWLWESGTRTFYSYDDEESLRHKTQYVREQGLGGVMFWEYSHNRGGELLDALYRGLRD